MDAEAYRGYCLQSVAAAYDIVLITDADPSWEVPYLRDCLVVPDLTDQKMLNAAGRTLARRHDVVGVFTWTEWYLVPVAHLAHHLGLPTPGPAAMHACRDKAAARETFARHHIPSAASLSVQTPLEARAAAAQIGYPVVLKPAAHAASIGVMRADTPEQLTAAYHRAHTTAVHGIENTAVLVEEYLDGPEISVECVTRDSITHAVAVTRKSVGPDFQEVGHSVDAADPLLDQVAPIAGAALQALGVTDGVSHIEMRLVDGEPHIVEVNGRLGGDLIGHLVHLATGMDLPRAAADLACNRRPDLTRTRSQAAAIHLLYPETSGRLLQLDLDGPHPPWLERVHFQHHPGDDLLLPADGGDMFTARLGALITTGPTADVAHHRAQRTVDRLTIAIEATASQRWDTNVA